MTKATAPPLKENMDALAKKSELTPDEAAIMLGVSKPTIHRWFNDGKLKGWRTSDAWNARIWIYTDSVMSFIKNVQGRRLPTPQKQTR